MLRIGYDDLQFGSSAATIAQRTTYYRTPCHSAAYWFPRWFRKEVCFHSYRNEHKSWSRKCITYAKSVFFFSFVDYFVFLEIYKTYCRTISSKHRWLECNSVSWSLGTALEIVQQCKRNICVWRFGNIPENSRYISSEVVEQSRYVNS